MIGTLRRHLGSDFVVNPKDIESEELNPTDIEGSSMILNAKLPIAPVILSYGVSLDLDVWGLFYARNNHSHIFVTLEVSNNLQPQNKVMLLKCDLYFEYWARGYEIRAFAEKHLVRFKSVWANATFDI